MIAPLNMILRQFRDAGTTPLMPEAILQACHDIGYTAWRERLLSPITTIRVFLLQILHGNTACAHLPHLTGLPFTASAYCQARAKLPLALFERIIQRMSEALEGTVEASERWHGHRTFFVDGSGVSMPDTPQLQNAFGHPTGQRPGCGFPVAHLLGLFHAGTGVLLKLLVDPLRTHDIATVPKIHPELQPGDLLVADRGFCSFGHLALVCRHRLQGLFRIQSRQLVDFTPHRAHVLPGSRGSKGAGKGRPRSRWLGQLGPDDQLVEWLKPRSSPPWLAPEVFASLPGAIRVRELRYRVAQAGFRVREITLATTLLDAEAYSKQSLAQLYFQRWEVETDFGHLKTTLKMDVLHCHTVAGVLKELAMFAVVYNLVRLVMRESGRLRGVPAGRISFRDALRWIGSPTAAVSLDRLVVNPARPDRWEPRVRKRRAKKFPYMTRPREELRNALAQKQLTA